MGTLTTRNCCECVAGTHIIDVSAACVELAREQWLLGVQAVAARVPSTAPIVPLGLVLVNGLWCVRVCVWLRAAERGNS
jgi:hypothetical protein